MLSRVKFEVTSGLHTELLNVLLEKDIYVCEVSGAKFGFSAICDSRDYKKISKLAKKYQCKTRIIKKMGIYFKLKFIIKRKGIIIGAILACALLFLYSHIIWTIDINTTSENIKNDIFTLLYENDIYVGSVFSKKKNSRVLQEIFINVEDIGYVTLNFSKGILECDVEEKIHRLSYLDDEVNGDIQSTADGVIKDIRVYQGFSNVMVGQAVSEGEIIVSAERINKHGVITQVAPRAYIKAYCKKEYVGEIPLKKNIDVRSGKYKKDVVLKFLGNDIKLKTAKKDKWGDYDIDTQFEFIEFLNFKLPITIETKTYYEKIQTTLYTNDEIAETAAKNVIETLIKSDPSVLEVFEKDYNIEITDNSIKIFCTVFGYFDITK